MFASYRPLLDALQARGADAHALQEAGEEFERSGRSIRDILINDRIVTEMELVEAAADAQGLNSVDLVGYPIDPAAMAKVPLSLVIRHRVLGISMTGNDLVVAISDPEDVVALDDVRAATGMHILPVVAARSELRKLIDRLKREDSDLGEV
ncbi:MAG: type pilus assembly protein PilB, partial [Gaiellaceae bacterium]|nr:type pilus assembly protein PilB [Gaiellaceae bacterium]